MQPFCSGSKKPVMTNRRKSVVFIGSGKSATRTPFGRSVRRRSAHSPRRGNGGEMKPVRVWRAMLPVFLLSVVLPSAVSGELIDRIVASVNNEVITLRDVRRAVAFNEALGAVSKGGKQLEKETLEGLINSKLVLLEARRLMLVKITEEEAAAEVAALKKRLGSEQKYHAVLDALGMDAKALSRMLEERVLVERFLEKKVGLFVRVSREEARKYFNDHPREFQGMRFQRAHKKIAARLLDRKADQQVRQYLGELRNRADVRENRL